MKKLFFLFFILLFPFPSHSLETFSARVVGVSDGDTLRVLHEGREEKLRLFGVDAPEKNQAYGKKAKEFTNQLAANQEVKIQLVGRDKYGRLLGEVILPDGKNLNQELVKEGYAWWYSQFSDDEAFGRLEKEAKENHRGLWADEAPVAPWDFRRQAKIDAGDSKTQAFQDSWKRGGDSVEKAMARKIVSHLSPKTIQAVLLIYGSEYCNKALKD